MKRLTIVHTEWSKGWGGQEIRIVSEASGVGARGHRVVIAARPECQILARASAAGLATYPLPMRNGFDLRAIAALGRIIRREQADIVNTHSSVDSWVGAFAAKLTRTKLIRTRHLSAPWRRHPLNFVYHMPDAIITTGEALRQQLIDHNRLDPGRILSIPTGIDVTQFSPRPCSSETKTALGIPASARVVTKVAVLRSFKRHDLLLDAIALLRERTPLYVVLVGGGSRREGIAAHAAARGIAERLRLVGHVEDVRPMLACSDVVVSASGSHEGVPQALAQALAMERPVVATNVGSVAELIEDQRTGLLVPPNDPSALAAAIERLLKDPTFAQECAVRGRTLVVQQYSHAVMIERLLALYERLLA
jgi:glycosyltransferase involved in cell wall biosynthesis